MKEPFGRQEEKKGHVMSWESKQNSASRRVPGNKIRKWFNMERIMKERQRENNESPLKDMKQDFNQYNNKYIIGLPILNRKYWYRKDVHSSQISLYFKKLKKILATSHGMQDLSPPSGVGSHPLQWKLRILTTGPPGKSSQISH